MSDGKIFFKRIWQASKGLVSGFDQKLVKQSYCWWAESLSWFWWGWPSFGYLSFR
jgi:hypothetical protein